MMASRMTITRSAATVLLRQERRQFSSVLQSSDYGASRSSRGLMSALRTPPSRPALTLERQQQYNRSLATAAAAAPVISHPTDPSIVSPHQASSQTPAPPQQTDYIRTAIQKLLEESQRSSGASSSTTENGASSSHHALNEDALLQQAVQSFQRQLENAKSCVNDCAEAGPHDWETELEAADAALEQAVAAYIDVLDSLREYSHLPSLSACWEEYRNAIPLKALRAELDRIKKSRTELPATA